MRRRRLIIATIIVSLLAIPFGWISWLLFVPAGQTGTVTLTVYRGDTYGQVADELQRLGLVRSRWWLDRWAHWRRLSRRLQAGIYPIPTPISLWRLVGWLSETKPQLIRLTVWEGMMAKEIAKRIEKLGLGDAEKFMDIVLNPQGRVQLPFEWQGDLEGTLFPTTYLIPPLREGEEAYIVQRMVNEFVHRFWKPYRDEIESSPFTLRQLVTIASMVQWEVKMDEERPTVAGVIINRLRRGMRLEIDATVLYALGQRKRRVVYSDLRLNSPYNTYRHAGLPPGAICSPSLPSLLAALRPADVPYLFYVARGDGYHTFSRTYEEHLQAVDAYRRWRERQRKTQIGSKR